MVRKQDKGGVHKEMKAVVSDLALQLFGRSVCVNEKINWAMKVPVMRVCQ